MKGLAVLVLVLHASDAERTPGEVARFGFPYQSCKAGEFEDDQPSSRKLELGTGGGCAEGPFGNHLGVVLNASLVAPGAYAPLISTESQTDFTADFTDGFTLELWVKPHKLPPDDTADRVIVSLSARNTEFTHEQMQTLNCTQDDVSFQLIVKPSGCLVVHAKFISTEDCSESSAHEDGVDGVGSRYSTFTLPGAQCDGVQFSSNPAAPGLNLTNPKLQHVVVSLSAYMGGVAGPGGDRGGQPDSKRFAIWVDSVLKTSDEHPTEVNKQTNHYVYRRLTGPIEDDPFEFGKKRGAPCAMKRTADYDLATDKTKNFVPSALWGADHTLRVGFDGTSNSPSFEGEVLWVRVRVSHPDPSCDPNPDPNPDQVLLLAMYPRPLNDSEVQANFEAKLDHSNPNPNPYPYPSPSP